LLPQSLAAGETSIKSQHGRVFSVQCSVFRQFVASVRQLRKSPDFRCFQLLIQDSGELRV
jgi:hypothetical protein